MRRLAILVLLLPVAACAVPPAAPYAVLPADATTGMEEPTRAAILGSAYAFGTPAALHGQPANAARAVARLEHLAAEIPAGPRWVEFSPLVGEQLLGARDEVRAALGIAPGAPPQAVVDGLFAASRALQLGDQAAAGQLLTAPAFPDGGATLARLQDMPPTPRARLALAMAAQELIRLDTQWQNMDRGGDGGRD